MTQLSIVAPTHDIPAKVADDLINILSWPRPHGSEAEKMFRTWLFNKMLKKKPIHLAEGCIFVQIEAKKDLQPTVLFSCHIDTVDSDSWGALVDGSIQRKSLIYDPNFGTIALDQGSKGSCLGADDGAGVWLMLQMIEKKVPGGYIFHTGEERGGVGSRAVLAKHLDLLKKFDIAVAFDRPNTHEVITHQGGQECASTKCGAALCLALNAHGMVYSQSTQGVFTDTKVYRGVVAECFNTGVGYENQHTKNETQDFAHLTAMLAALCAIDWDSLPVDRDPLKADTYGGYPKLGRSYGGQAGYGYGGYGGYGGHGGFDRDDEPYAYQPPKNKGKKYKAPQAGPTLSLFDELRTNKREELEAWAETAPGAVADAMVHLLLEIGRLRSDVAILRKVAGVSDD